MATIIKTIITYNISDETLNREFTTFLEKECKATHDEDQSTYVSPKDKEDILQLLKNKSFPYGSNDFVNLYYCRDKRTASQSLPINKIRIC